MLILLSKHKAIALTTSRITLSSTQSMSLQRFDRALPWQHCFQIICDLFAKLQRLPCSMDLLDSVPIKWT